MEEPVNRLFNERKRKFVETELAQDTEGNAIENWYIREVALFKFFECVCDMNGVQSGVLSWKGRLFLFPHWRIPCLSFPELFQDLSQLQEIWIAEGEFWYIYHWAVLFSNCCLYLSQGQDVHQDFFVVMWFAFILVPLLQPRCLMMSSLFQISSRITVSSHISLLILMRGGTVSKPTQSDGPLFTPKLPEPMCCNNLQASEQRNLSAERLLGSRIPHSVKVLC